MKWNFDISVANAQAAVTAMNDHFGNLWDKFGEGLGKTILKFNVWQKAFDYIIDLTKQMVKESRELIAISTKYDIPIARMGEFQQMARLTGQSVGQLARTLPTELS